MSLPPNPFPLSSLRLTVYNGGAYTDLNQPGPVGIKCLGYDGLGHMGIRRLSQKAPRQRGTTDLALSQDARYFGLILEIQGRDLIHFGELREAVLAAFMPREGDPLVVTFNVFGQVRALRGNMDGDMDFPAGDRQYTRQVVSIALKADDPRLYFPTQREVNFFPTSGAVGWEVPWEIPWTIGAGTANATTTVTYAGGSFAAAAEYPLLRLFGPIIDPILTNETTGERLAFPGLSYAAGEFVTIDLGAGPYLDSSPRIRNHLDVSVEQYLSSDSDLATWHFAPAGELLSSGFRSDGDNVIRVQGTGATTNTRLQMLYYDRFTGV